MSSLCGMRKFRDWSSPTFSCPESVFSDFFLFWSKPATRENNRKGNQYPFCFFFSFLYFFCFLFFFSLLFSSGHFLFFFFLIPYWGNRKNELNKDLNLKYFFQFTFLLFFFLSFDLNINWVDFISWP